MLKAEDMAVKNYFSHTSPLLGSMADLLALYDINWRFCGENIAKGQTSPENVMNSWMDSPGHKANILSPNYGKIGVGCYTDPHGYIYWVQEFTN